MVVILRKMCEMRPSANTEQKNVMLSCMYLVKRLHLNDRFPATIELCKSMWTCTLLSEGALVESERFFSIDPQLINELVL